MRGAVSVRANYCDGVTRDQVREIFERCWLGRLMILRNSCGLFTRLSSGVLAMRLPMERLRVSGIELRGSLPICMAYGAPDDLRPSALRPADKPIVRPDLRPRALFAFGVIFLSRSGGALPTPLWRRERQNEHVWAGEVKFRLVIPRRVERSGRLEW
jgi:hypothetical protein